MIDKFKFKGHFSIQALNKDNEVISEYIDDNMIMNLSKLSAPEIFAGLSTSKSINRLVIGTKGAKDSDILTPKDSSDGFINSRDRMFSEYRVIEDGEVHNLLKGDVIKYNGTLNSSATVGNYYENKNATITSFDPDTYDFSLLEDLGTTEPYNYGITYNLPGTNGDYSSSVEDDNGDFGGNTVQTTVNNNVLEFEYYIDNNVANNTGVSYINEAALYANDRIFSFKTFNMKTKDNTVSLRINWKIIF